MNKDLINEICAKLNFMKFTDCADYGIEGIPFSPESQFGAGLRYVPDENGRAMLECDISDCKTFREVYQTWGRAKALRFIPYILPDSVNDNPTLAVRHNRYIHMFRGHRFQASWTPDGHGSGGESSYRMCFLTQADYYNQVLTKGLISYMLWWAAFIDIGFQFKNFIDMFDTERDTLDGFLAKSITYWGGDMKYHWTDIEPYIVHSVGNIDLYQREVIQLKDKNGVWAYLAIGEKTIQVETTGNSLCTITVPDLNLGSGYNLEDEDDRDAFEADKYILEQNHYLEMLAVMALKLSNIHISFINFYTLLPHAQTMLPINRPNVISAESLNQIYGVTPDKF